MCVLYKKQCYIPWLLCRKKPEMIKNVGSILCLRYW